MIPLTLISILISILISAAAAAEAAANHVTTPSGSRIASHLVRAALPSRLRSAAVLENHVFEISHADSVLLGPASFALPLAQLTESRTVRTHPDLKVTLNGEAYHAHHQPENRVRILSGNGFTLVLQGNLARPLALWGNGVNLRPLHILLHPYVLVNIPSDTSTHTYTDTDNDMVPPPANSNANSYSTETGLEDPPVVARQAITCTASRPKIVEVAVAFDTTFCAQFAGVKSAAVGALQAMFDETNIPYRRDTCVELALVDVEGACGSKSNDAYAFIETGMQTQAVAARAGYIYEQFRKFFTNNRRNVQRDTAFFLFNYDDGTRTAGLAGWPSTCNNRGYGWVKGMDPYVLAHEVAHNLNCAHDPDSGIMKPVVDSSQRFFSPLSIATIKDYIEDGGVERFQMSSQCITDDAPSCSASCPNACAGGRCVAPVKPGRGFSSCKPAASNVYCSKIVDVNSNTKLNQRIDCPAGRSFVSVDFNANDPEILCCSSVGAQTAPAASQLDNGLSRLSFNAKRFPDVIVSRRTGRFSDASIRTFSFFRTLSTTCTSGGTAADPAPPSEPAPRVPAPAPPTSPASTCGRAFTDERHMRCGSAARATLSVADVGRFKLAVNVRFATFHWKVIGLNGRRIAYSGAVFNTGPGKNTAGVTVFKELSSKPKRKVAQSYTVPISDMPLAASSTSCCGTNKARGVFDVALCTQSGKCTRAKFAINLDIPCAPLCARGTPVAMSKDRQCGGCRAATTTE